MILAGGRGRRLGGKPKGLELVGGKRILERVAEALRAVAGDVVLAANDARASEWLPGLPVVADRYKGAGGLAGADAAFARYPGRDLLVVAWDMPFVTGGVLGSLLGAAMETGADVVLPESPSPHGFEPFCGFYSARVHEPLSRFLSSGGGPARDFIGRLARVHLLDRATLAPLGDPARLFLSVNTAADLARAGAMAEAAQ